MNRSKNMTFHKSFEFYHHSSLLISSWTKVWTFFHNLDMKNTCQMILSRLWDTFITSSLIEVTLIGPSILMFFELTSQCYSVTFSTNKTRRFFKTMIVPTNPLLKHYWLTFKMRNFWIKSMTITSRTHYHSTMLIPSDINHLRTLLQSILQLRYHNFKLIKPMKSSTRKKRNIIIKNQATMKVQEIQSQPLFMKKIRTGVKRNLTKDNKKKLKRNKRNLNKKLLKKNKNSRNNHPLEFQKKPHPITVIPRITEEIEVKREATIETTTEVIGEATTTMTSLTMATETKSHTTKNKLSSKKSQSAMTGILSRRSRTGKRFKNQESNQLLNKQSSK